VSALLLTEAQWAERMRADVSVKDKSYQLYPLGMEVAKFLRAKRVERASVHTLLSYETTLRLLVLFFLDYVSPDETTPGAQVVDWNRFCGPEAADEIIGFLEHHWGDSAPATLDNRIGAVRSFFAWAEETGRIVRAPRIKRRRVDGRIREAHELDEIRYIVSQQTDLSDEVALLLAGRLAFRKDDVRRFRVRDVDLVHDRVFIRKGKGEKPVELPIAFDDVRQALSLWTVDRHPDEVLWHPRGHPSRYPDPSTVHRRFKRCLERAGVDDFEFHELRHSAGDRLWRQTGDIYAAKMLLRHASVATTERYLHPTHEDLRARMRASDDEA